MNRCTTKTASLKATIANVRKLSINGLPFSKVVSDNVLESPTENDIWKYDVVTDDEGVVTINTDVTVDYTELTDVQKDILKTAIKVIDNKVLGENDALLMNWDTKNFTNIYGMGMDSIFGGRLSQQAPITEWDSDLSSLTDGGLMFNNTALTSWNIDLSSLTNGESMFANSTLESFNVDLPSLTNGRYMFDGTALKSFNSDLPSLTEGSGMFINSAFESFNSDLPNLTNGSWMFSFSDIQSFNVDLSSLTNGSNMFYESTLESFEGDLSSLINGEGMFYNTALKSFISDLSSLKCGYNMFYNVPLEEESIMFISDTINNISTLNKSLNSVWTYEYHDYDGNLTTATISEDHRGILYLSYDSSIKDTTNIFKYCGQIVTKGWTVYLNGSQYVPSDSDSAALINGESSTTPIPYYYKPIQVTDEEIAEFVDQNGNYYIIVGAQHVFGDDISTYGMFTSYDHAVTEITLELGLTPHENPTKKPKI